MRCSPSNENITMKVMPLIEAENIPFIAEKLAQMHIGESSWFSCMRRRMKRPNPPEVDLVMIVSNHEILGISIIHKASGCCGFFIDDKYRNKGYAKMLAIFLINKYQHIRVSDWDYPSAKFFNKLTQTFPTNVTKLEYDPFFMRCYGY